MHAAIQRSPMLHTLCGTVYAKIVDVFQLINTFRCVLVTKNETKDKGNTMASFSKQQILGDMKIVYVETRAVGITELKSRVAI